MNYRHLIKKQAQCEHLCFNDQLKLGTFPLTNKQIADLCHIDRQTVKRWKDKNCVSIAVRRLLWIVCSGFLPDTPTWQDISRAFVVMTVHGHSYVYKQRLISCS